MNDIETKIKIHKEYESIFCKMSEREVAYAKEYLSKHTNLTLHDIYYKDDIAARYHEWRDYKDIKELTNWIITLNNTSMNKQITELLIDYIYDFEELRDYILEYAEDNLSELSEKKLLDKFETIEIIESCDLDFLLQSNSDLKENFIICCKGGMVRLKDEIEERRIRIEHSENKNSYKKKEYIR